MCDSKQQLISRVKNILDSGVTRWGLSPSRVGLQGIEPIEIFLITALILRIEPFAVFTIYGI
jgi:hypothetical protein